MADFWSQYKNDFPDLGGFTPAGQIGGPNGGINPDFKMPPSDFNLGGFQQQTPAGFKLGQGVPENSEGPGGFSGQNQQPGGYQFDPRVTTQPQPWLQGPGMDMPTTPTRFPVNQPNPNPQPGDMPWIDHTGQAPSNEWTGGITGKAPDPRPDWMKNGQPSPYGNQPLPDWMKKGPVPMAGSPMSMQHMMGSMGGGQGDGFTGQFGGGIAIGPNGGFINPGDGSPYQGGSSLGQMGQPMNPGQQSGQVGMRSPDGQHFQYVNAEHVPHYQGLGAQVVNGSSYGSGQ